MYVWGQSDCSGFPSKSKDLTIRSIDYFKLPLAVCVVICPLTLRGKVGINEVLHSFLKLQCLVLHFLSFSLATGV